MQALVSIHNGEPRTTTVAISQGTGTEHRAVVQLVRSYKDDMEEFGPFAFEMRKGRSLPQGGYAKATMIAHLNEQQATLIMTYMKNTPVVREFKKRLVRAFFEFRSKATPPSLFPDPPVTIKRDRYIELLEAENEKLRWERNIKGAKQLPEGKGNFLYHRFMELYGNRMSVDRFMVLYSPPCTKEMVNSILYRKQRPSATLMAALMQILQFTPEEINQAVTGCRGERAYRAVMPTTAQSQPLLPEEPAKKKEVVRMARPAANRDHHEPKPKTIEEVRQMARVKAATAAPFWGLNRDTLSRRCVRGEVPGATKIGGEWFVTPEGMDALFSPRKAARTVRK